mmetsp:Transcript_31546/g.67231  ORF Transcript_31546/g.67231 Transcript_31546/m.67231 type:complete len:83 (-) Transcript_31546:51-299(-)
MYHRSDHSWKANSTILLFERDKALRTELHPPTSLVLAMISGAPSLHAHQSVVACVIRFPSIFNDMMRNALEASTRATISRPG